MVSNLLYYQKLCSDIMSKEHLILERIISIEDIDSIHDHPNAITIELTGLKQDTFNYFVDNFGNQFKAISFFKCPKVADLSMLSRLNKVEYIFYYWNQKADRLWDMSSNFNLKGISLNDFTRMHNLSEFSAAPQLEELDFGCLVWNKYIVSSLSPLMNCKSLLYLSFNFKHISDDSIEALIKIPNLQELNFPANQFSTEQVAWLRAHLSESVIGNSLFPYIKINEMVRIVGKRKPLLDPIKHAKRIDNYVISFEALVNMFRLDKNLRSSSINNVHK